MMLTKDRLRGLKLGKRWRLFRFKPDGLQMRWLPHFSQPADIFVSGPGQRAALIANGGGGDAGDGGKGCFDTPETAGSEGCFFSAHGFFDARAGCSVTNLRGCTEGHAVDRGGWAF